MIKAINEYKRKNERKNEAIEKLDKLNHDVHNYVPNGHKPPLRLYERLQETNVFINAYKITFPTYSELYSKVCLSAAKSATKSLERLDWEGAECLAKLGMITQEANPDKEQKEMLKKNLSTCLRRYDSLKDYDSISGLGKFMIETADKDDGYGSWAFNRMLYVSNHARVYYNKEFQIAYEELVFLHENIENIFEETHRIEDNQKNVIEKMQELSGRLSSFESDTRVAHETVELRKLDFEINTFIMLHTPNDSQRCGYAQDRLVKIAVNVNVPS